MTFSLAAGISVSIDGINYFPLTDHNRKEIEISAEVIETVQRMANGKMRKYVVAQKAKISTSWTYVPSKKSLTVDNNYSSAWLDAFYDANVGIPLYVKINSSEIDSAITIGNAPTETNSTFKASTKNSGLPALQETTIQNKQINPTVQLSGSQIYNVFITDYSSTVIHRTVNCDYVSMNIEFTEI